MTRTASMWALTALSTSVLAHAPSKSNYTNTATPEVQYQGYSTSLIETPYTAETTSSTPQPASPKPSETTTMSLPVYSTWLAPSYTQAVPYTPSSAVLSTWLGPSYTVAVPLYPSASTYPAYTPSGPGISSAASSATQPSITVVIPVPTSSVGSASSATASSPTGSSVFTGSSAFATSSPSASSIPLPTISLGTSAVSSVLSSVTSTSVVGIPSSSAATSSIPAETLSSASSPLAETTSQYVTSTLSSTAAESSSTPSSITESVTSSSEAILSTTRPTAVGSTIRYTLTTSASASTTTQTTTTPPPAPPAYTGAASGLGTTGSDRVWWLTFLLPLLFL